MIQKRASLLLLVFLLLLASCTDSPPPMDWCYLYNFAESDYDADITNGAWADGFGFTQNASGLLIFSIPTGYVVEAQLAILTVARPPETGGVDVLGSFDVFGVGFELDEYYSEDLPDELELSFNQTSAGAIGSAINVSFQGVGTLYLQSIEVLGNGANPFPDNLCDDDTTPTPSPTHLIPDTDVPSATPVPPTETPTDEPTWSPTPSNTPAATCTYVYDFSEDEQGFTLPDMNEGWSGVFATYSGGAWHSELIYQFDPADAYYTFINVQKVLPHGFLKEVRAYASGTTGETQEDVPNSNIAIDDVGMGRPGDSQLITVLNPPGDRVWADLDLDVSVGVHTLRVVYLPGYNGTFGGGAHDPGGSAALTRVEVDLIGGDCEDATPTPSQTPSPTPSRTYTPSVTLRPRTNTPGPSPTRTAIIIASPPPPTAIPPTSTATTPPASGTPMPSATYIPSPTPHAPLPPDDPDEPGGGWGTCGDDIEINSLDDFSTFVSQFWNCSVVAYFANIINQISGFFNWVGNSATNLFNWIGGMFGWFTGTLENLSIQLGNFWQLVQAILALIRFVLDSIWNIIRLVIALIRLLFEIVFGWLSQLAGRAQALVLAWYQSPAEPIPSLPLCASNPTAYDICAVYYVLENTMLSGGIGGLIIPVLVIILDLGIVLFFIKAVRSLLKKTGSITQ